MMKDVTENSSPENLRKFIESNDPAMILMGLSMAKGNANTSRGNLGRILGLYMFHDDKNIRASSKAAFTKLASSDSKKIVKEYWQAEYRNQSWIWESGWIKNILTKIDGAGINPFYILVGALEKKDYEIEVQIIKIIESWNISATMQHTLDDETSEVIINALFQMIAARTSKRSYWKPDFTNEIKAIRIIEAIGGEQSLEAFIKILESDYRLTETVANALGALGNIRAVEPLIRQLSDKNKVEVVSKALGIIGDAKAVEPLIGAIEIVFSDSGYYRKKCTELAKALGKLGDIRAIEPLVKGLDINSLNIEERTSITDSISLILERLEIDMKEINNLKRFLTGQDPGMRTMGLSMLKGILKDV